LFDFENDSEPHFIAHIMKAPMSMAVRRGRDRALGTMEGPIFDGTKEVCPFCGAPYFMPLQAVFLSFFFHHSALFFPLPLVLHPENKNKCKAKEKMMH